MTLLAVSASAVAAFFVAGYVVGTPPRIGLPRRHQERRTASAGQQWLTQAGVALTPRQFWTGSTVIGLLAYLGVLGITATPVVALAPAVTVALLPRWALARQRSRRLREVQEAWPDGLRQLRAAIATGRSLPQAVAGLAADGPIPLRKAFARFPVLLRMIGMVPALETIKAELADPTSDRVIEVLVLAHERGGRTVGDILHDLADATTTDVATLEQIETDALEQKINARAVFALPWLVLLMLCSRPGHFRDFYASGQGLVVVAIGGALSLLGMWLVGRLAREPVEPRVLVPGEPPLQGRP